MDITSPQAFWWLGLVALLLFLARGRIVRRRRAVANLFLWEAPAQRDPLRLALRRVLRTRRLALQAAAMLALVAALAGPVISAYWSAPVGVVVDVSMSMAAREGTATRLDVATERARALISQLPGRTRVRLVAAAATPTLLGEFAAADPRVSSALDTLRATAGPADLVEAVRVAAEGPGGGAVHVVTDNGRAVPEGSRVVSVGTAAENLAIVRLSVRPLPNTRTDAEVLTTVRNFGRVVHEGALTIAHEGAPATRERFRLEGGVSRSFVARAAGARGVVRASLDVDDALDVDNHRLSLVPPTDPIRVRLEGEESYFLRQALAVNPAFLVEVASGEPPRAAPTADAYDVVVCAACAPSAALLSTDTAGVLIVAPPGADAAAVAVRRPLLLSATTAGQAVARSIDLTGVTAVPLTGSPLPPDGDVLIRAGGVPAVVGYEREGRRVVQFRLDVGAGDFPLNPAFPLLISSLVEWISRRAEDERDRLSGDLISWTIAGREGDDVARVVGPAGSPVPSQSNGRRVTVAATGGAALYTLHLGAASRPLVVNPATEGESDLLSVARSDETSVAESGGSRQGIALQMPLLLLAFGALCAEWWVR